MKYFKITLFLLLVAFQATGSFAQKQNSTSEIDSLKKQIEKLEKELSSHDSGIRSIDYKLNFVHAKAVEAEEKDYKTERELWKEHFGLFELAFTLVVALLTFFGIKNRLEEKVKKKLDEIVKDPKRIEAMEAKIDKHLAENKFKEEIKRPTRKIWRKIDLEKLNPECFNQEMNRKGITAYSAIVYPKSLERNILLVVKLFLLKGKTIYRLLF